MSLRNRLLSNRSHVALLCALALVGTLIVTAVPRYSDHLAVQALGADLARAEHGARDFTLSTVRPAAARQRGPAALVTYREQFPSVLADAVEDQWFAASTQPGTTVVPSGPRARLRLRTQTGLTDAAVLAAGAWPATAPQKGYPVPIVVSTQIAGMFGVGVGDELSFDGLTVKVSGLFEPRDRDAPIWADVPTAIRVAWPMEDDPLEAVAFTDPAGLAVAAQELGDGFLTWRYRFDGRRLSKLEVEDSIAAVVQAQRAPYDDDVRAATGLDELLQNYADQTEAARSLLAVVQLGVIAPLLGAIVLAARSAVERRRQEYALLRARGARVVTVGQLTLAETASTVPVAVLVGWGIGGLAAGNAAGTGWSALGVGAVAVLTAPLLAMVAVRRPALTTSRRDLARARPSAPRLTAEFCVLALALIGAYLLRLRGLGAQVDVYLAAVPVLLSSGAALLGLRVLPISLRSAARFSERTRGVVIFLSLNRVARSAGITGAPLAVLVVAVTTALFTGAVGLSIDDARDRATDTAIGADALLQGIAFAPDTVRRLAEVPGVEAVASAAMEWSATVGRDARGPTVPAFFVDVPAYQRVLERGDVHVVLPPELTRARPASAAVPVVVSPAVAAEVGGPGTATVVSVRGRSYDVVIGAVADNFPGIGVGTRMFVVLPWQALPTEAPIAANRLLIAGAGADAETLRTVGDDGQRAYVRSELGRQPAGVDYPPEMLTWSGHRAGLDSTGANGVLSFVLAIGVFGGAVMALVAVSFAVLVSAVPRGQALSRLRTMGLAAGTGRLLLVVELVPLVGLAAVIGVTLGVLLPVLLRPALDLTVFTAGVQARTAVELLLVGGVLVLVAISLVVAVITESTINNRLRLGEALRVAEER